MPVISLTRGKVHENRKIKLTKLTKNRIMKQNMGWYPLGKSPVKQGELFYEYTSGFCALYHL